jgi:hypothetical protein
VLDVDGATAVMTCCASPTRNGSGSATPRAAWVGRADGDLLGAEEAGVRGADRVGAADGDDDAVIGCDDPGRGTDDE